MCSAAMLRTWHPSPNDSLHSSYHARTYCSCLLSLHALLCSYLKIITQYSEGCLLCNSVGRITITHTRCPADCALLVPGSRWLRPDVFLGCQFDTLEPHIKKEHNQFLQTSWSWTIAGIVSKVGTKCMHLYIHIYVCNPFIGCQKHQKHKLFWKTEWQKFYSQCVNMIDITWDHNVCNLVVVLCCVLVVELCCV